MNEKIIQEELASLAAEPGVQACALVEASSGFVWHAAGHVTVAAPLWEAAIDYWRLHRRMSGHFSALGELGAAVMYHQLAMLVVLPCATQEELLVVCIASHQSVAWRPWQQRVVQMGQRITQG
jgi:hypothetical protein